MSLTAVLACIATGSVPTSGRISGQEGPVAESRMFNGESVFVRDMTAADLIEHFGAANVTNGEIQYPLSNARADPAPATICGKSV